MIQVKVTRNEIEESVGYFTTELNANKYISEIIEDKEIFTDETIITVERFNGFQHFS